MSKDNFLFTAIKDNFLFTAIKKVTKEILVSTNQKNDLPTFDTITFDDFIGYFATNKPTSDSKVMKYLILREEHELGWVYTQLFVDENESPLKTEDGKAYGRKLIVKLPDKEINSLFGDSHSVILE